MQQTHLPLFPHLDPSHPFELQAARQLVARALRSLIVGQRISLDHAAALWLGERLLSLDPSGAAAELLAVVRSDCENAVVLDAFTSLHGLLATNVETTTSPLQDRLDRMAILFDLSAAEKQILGIAIRCSGFGLTSGIAAITKSLKTDYMMGGRDHLPVLTGLSQNRVEALLADDAPLFAHGLLTGSDCELGNTTMLALEAKTFDEQSLLETFLSPQATTLHWDDYSHLHDQLAPVERILRATCEQEIDGINILFHGVPGTGKSELAKLLAGRLDMPVVTLEGYEGRERRGRSPDLVGLFRARKHLVRLIDRAMLVIDEADDLLSGINDPLLSARPASKLHIHESVERGARPTIWITNHPERLGASVLRRMTIAVDFRVPAK